MAVKYVRSSAAGSGTGADWTNAYTTLTLGLAGVSAGDTIYIADDHAESSGGALAFNSPGTPGNPVNIVCVNTHVTTPPTAVATSGTISGTTIAFGSGYAYTYGIGFTATTNALAITWNNGSSFGWVHDTCTFTLTGGTSSTFQVCRSGFVATEYVKWVNCSVAFAGTGNNFNVCGRWDWNGGAVLAGAAIPTSLIIATGTIPGSVFISGVDLSQLGSGKALVASAGTNPVDVFFRNCKLGASVSVISGTVNGPGGVRVFLDNCDSSNTNYRMEHYKYQGSIITETTKVRTGGATDGTTPLSHKFVSLTTGPTLFSPLEGPWMSVWNDTVGSSVTATIEFLHDSVTNLKNSDIYLEVEYLGTSSLPLSVYSLSRVADIFATGTNCAAGVGTGSWTTTGLTNPNSQKLTVTFTPQVKGPVRARVCIIKSNYTVYADPLLTVA